MANMATKKAVDVRGTILEMICSESLRPAELLVQLRLHGVSESVAKDALADLMDEGAVELSRDRYVRPTAQAALAS